MWAPTLARRRFLISCDNEAAVTVINSGVTRDCFMQRCLRQLWFTASLHDFEIRASFIPGDHNTLADALSRWQLTGNSKSQRDFYFYRSKVGIQYSFIEVPEHLLRFQVS